MANINIVHSTVKQDAPAAGVQGANQGLFAADWNGVHFIVSAGSGIQIVTDSGSPPTLTFSAGGSQISSVGGGFQTSGPSTFNGTVNIGPGGSGILFQSSATGFAPNANGSAIILVGCPDLIPSGDLCSDYGRDTNRVLTIITPTWRNVGGSGLTMQVGNYSILWQDALPGAVKIDNVSHANNLDFGTSSLTFRNAYFGSTISAGTGFQTSDTTQGVQTPRLSAPTGFDLLLLGATTNFAPANNNSQTLGRRDLLWSAIYGQTISAGGGFQTNASNLISTANGVALGLSGSSLFVNATFIPGSDNTLNLGTGTNRWANIFGVTISAGTGFQTNASFSLTANAIDFLSNGTFVLEVTNSADIIVRPGAGTQGQSVAGGAFRPFVADDNFKDIGSATARWRSGFFGTNVSAGSGFLSNGTSTLASINPAVDSTYSLGSQNLRWNVIFVTQMSGGSSSITSFSDILPTGDKQRSLGSAANEWNNVFGTTLSAATAFQTNGSITVGNVSGVSQAGGVFIQQNSITVGNIQVTAGLAGQPGAPRINGDGTSIYLEANAASLFLRPGGTGVNSRGVQADNAGTGSFHPISDDNGVDLGISGTRFRHIFFGGSLNNGLTLTSIGTTIVPNTDNSYDLGNATTPLRWRNAYVQGTLSAGTDNAGTGGVYTATIYAKGGSELSFQSTNASGAPTDRMHMGSGNLYPITGAMDFGLSSMGNNAWKNGYFQQTVSVGTAGTGAFFSSTVLSAGGQIQTNSGIVVGAAQSISSPSGEILMSPAGTIFMHFGAASAYPDSDNTKQLGLPAGVTPRQFSAIYAYIHSAATNFQTNTSSGMAFGGSAVGGSAPSNLVDKIPVTINGVTRYIGLYAN